MRKYKNLDEVRELAKQKGLDELFEAIKVLTTKSITEDFSKAGKDMSLVPKSVEEEILDCLNTSKRNTRNLVEKSGLFFDNGAKYKAFTYYRSWFIEAQALKYLLENS